MYFSSMVGLYLSKIKSTQIKCIVIAQFTRLYIIHVRGQGVTCPPQTFNFT